MTRTVRRAAAVVTACLVVGLAQTSDVSGAPQRRAGDICPREGRTVQTASGELRCTRTRQGLVWRTINAPGGSTATTVPGGTGTSTRQPGDTCPREGRTIQTASGTLRCTATRRGLIWRIDQTAVTPTTTTTVPTATTTTTTTVAPPSGGGGDDDDGGGAEPSPSFTVTFNANGGTGAMQPQNASSATALTLNTLSRTGYTFSGWNTSANGSGTAYANQASYPFTSSTTLYAQWTANSLTVTYDSQGGSAISSGLTSTGGQIVSSPGTPTRAGYTFSGWFTAASGGSAISFPYTHGQTANFTLYAQWVPAFNTNVGSGANNRVYSAVVQADGKIIVAGEFSSWNGTSADYVVRLNSDGTKDTSFNTGNFGYVNVPTVRAVAVQTDGKVILVGGFSSWNGQSVGRIVRLNVDGSVDGGFTANNGTGAGGYGLSTVTIQADGKILVGGSGLFNQWNGATVSGLVRLNPDGTRDLAFSTKIGTGGGVDGAVSTVRLQPDGKILVAGSFSQWNGAAVRGFIRLNSDGSRDESFASNIGSAANGWAEGIAVQADGKILVAGIFSQWNGASVSRLIRLHSDGTLDSTFVANIGTGPERVGSTGYAEQVVVRTDGKILVGGQFQTWNGTATIGLVRLNADGTIETSFVDALSDSESGNPLPSFTVLPTGQVLVYGAFTSWKGQTVGRFIRLSETDTLD